MSTQIQRRRGTTAQHASFTGAVGETTIDTDKDVVVVHDGVQVGGYPLMRENGSNSALALGSAGTPSLKFTGDTNTGIYSPGADQVAISTGGSGRITIDASGNVNIDSNTLYVDATNNRVGIGTTPSTLLHIQSTDPAFRFKRSDAGTDAYGELTTDVSGLVTMKCDPANAAAGSGFRITVDNSEALRITSTGALNFVGAGTAGSTQAVSFNGSAPVNSLVIDSSGRLGVGTSSPTAPLHVVSTSAGYTTTMLAIGEQSASTGRQLFLGMHTTDGKGYIQSVHWGTAYKELLLNPNGGNVGIGTGSPGYPLTVNGRISYIGAIGEGADTTLSSASTQIRLAESSTWQSLSLYTAGSPRLFINSTGNVGIGVTPSAAKLEVAGGNIRLDNNQGVEWGGVNNYIYGNETTDFIAIATNGNDRLRIDSSGRCGIGTTSPVGKINSVISQADTSSSSDTTLASSFLHLGGGEYGNGRYFLTTYGYSTGRTNSGAYIGARGADSTGYGKYDLVFGTRDVTTDTAPTERMRITSGGYLKASNTGNYYSATANFHELTTNTDSVTLITRNTSATLTNTVCGIYTLYSGAAPNNTLAAAFYFEDTAAVRAVIRSNGGLANYQANNVNLSDINAKKDITPAPGTWDCLKEWEIVNYRYKDQPDDADLNLGVIAQQVAESCPEVITIFSEAKDAKPVVLDDDGNEVEPALDAQPEKLGVKEQQMYWMAIKALQEAQIRIEQLEKRLTDAGIA